MATETNKIILQVEVDDKGQVDINKLKKSIKGVSTEIEKVNDVSKKMSSNLGNIRSETGSASGAVVELGRTISDSNYGFPAMANNVQQLATQFTFVVAEQGGVAKGFKAIGKAMRGAGGLLLLFTLAVTLLERFALNSRKATKETNLLAESIGKEVGQLNALISVAKNENLQKKDREDAIKEINDEYPEYLGNLSLEKIRTDDVTKAIGKQIKLEVARVKVKQLSANISKAQEDLAKAELKTAEDTATATDKLSAAGKIIGQSIPSGVKVASGAFGALLTLTPKVIDKAKEVGEAIGDFSEEVAEKSGFNDEVLQKGVKRRNEAIKTANSELKKSMSEFDKFMKESGFSFEELFGDEGEQKRNKLLDLLKDYQDKVLELGSENEQQLLNIKRNAALKEAEELGANEEQLLVIEKYYDDLSYELFLENANKRIAEREKQNIKEIKAKAKVEREKLRIEKQSVKARENVQLQSLSFSKSLATMFSNIANEDKTLKAISFILQKGSAIAEIIVKANTSIASQKIANAAANQAIIAKYAGVPFGGVLAVKETVAAKASLVKDIARTKRAAAFSIASIAATSIKGGGSTASGEAGGGGTVSSPTIEPPQFNIVGASAQSQLAQTIAEAEQQPTRAYVVAEDITSAQQLDRETIQGASLG